MISNGALLFIEEGLGPSGIHVDVLMISQKELVNGLVVLESVFILLGLRDEEDSMNKDSLSSFFRMAELSLVLPFRKNSFRVVLGGIDRVVLSFQTSDEFLAVIINSDRSDGEKVVNVLISLRREVLNPNPWL